MAKRSLSAMTLTDLQRELRRRQRGVETRVRRLERKRESMAAKLAAIDAELAQHGRHMGRVGAAGGRRRPRNEMKLADALVKVLTNSTMSVTDAAVAVQKAGYQTTSPSFRTIVNQTLLKDKRFKRVERGQYTAKG